MSDHQRIACCGIDCATCDIYIASHNPEAAQRLAEAMKSDGSLDAEAGWFRCQGCHGDRNLCWSDDCDIHPCCTDKGLMHCGQCADFPCETYQSWVGNWPHHRMAHERLLAMRTDRQADDDRRE